MWMAVDRTEGDYVILIDDESNIHQLTQQEYLKITGRPPVESHVLRCELAHGKIISAAYDPEETQRRLDAARARLERLKQRSNS